jgi:protein FRG1
VHQQRADMVKPLSFKGDKKVKKRKHARVEEDGERNDSKALAVAGGADTVEEDDSWVTAEALVDLTGPVVVAVPTEPPTCIACDANGTVFLSELENLVEGDVTTAEPHDVRQVWIANRIAGTDSVSLKGHHGR